MGENKSTMARDGEEEEVFNNRVYHIHHHFHHHYMHPWRPNMNNHQIQPYPMPRPGYPTRGDESVEEDESVFGHGGGHNNHGGDHYGDYGHGHYGHGHYDDYYPGYNYGGSPSYFNPYYPW